MQSSARVAVLAGAVLGFAGVALGAFGAHALENLLENSGRMDTWKTAVLYHLVHAVALVAAAALPLDGRKAITGCWVAGVVLFSGSLYALCLSGLTVLGAITPLGGLAFLGGWVFLLRQAWRSEKIA